MIISNQHISIATKIASQSDIIKARMAAIAITKNGRIICTANNRRLQGNYKDWSIHAERALINKLNKLQAFSRFKDISIFVFRISSLGISMAKPCAKCQKLLANYPVRILYTSDGGKINEL
jgi:cytidine deaminase